MSKNSFIPFIIILLVATLLLLGYRIGVNHQISITNESKKSTLKEVDRKVETFDLDYFFHKKQSFRFASLQLHPLEKDIIQKYGEPDIRHSGEYYEERAYTSEDSIISYYGISLNTVESFIVSNKYLGISSKGIKIGSTEKELFAAYSFPKYKMEKEEEVVYYYGDNGHYFIFQMKNSVVQGMGWISQVDNGYFDMILDEGRIKKYIH